MKHSPAARALISHYEGCRLSAYPDPGTGGDPWTIGVGATGAGIRQGVTWTQAQCDARLDADLTRFDAGVSELIGGIPTTQGQFDALVCFAFNVGLGNLKKSTLLARHKAGDHVGAAVEFAKWTKAAGRVLSGLVKRRAAEADLYSGREPN